MTSMRAASTLGRLSTMLLPTIRWLPCSEPTQVEGALVAQPWIS